MRVDAATFRSSHTRSLVQVCFSVCGDFDPPGRRLGLEWHGDFIRLHSLDGHPTWLEPWTLWMDGLMAVAMSTRFDEQ